MRTYAVRAGCIPAAKLALFERLTMSMQAMPDLDPAEDVSCHAVCRALAHLHPEATCVDGFFGGVGHEHSWLDLGDGIIADMTPIAGAGPFLVDASHWMVPWHRLYVERADMLDHPNRARGRAEHQAVADALVASMDTGPEDRALGGGEE